MYKPTSVWQWAFIGTTAVQAVIALALEGYVLGLFQVSLADDAAGSSITKTIPTYLSLLIFAFIYQLILVYDALHYQNTIQVIGLCIYNVGILVYAAIQEDQIGEAINTPPNNSSIKGDHGDLWEKLRPFLISVPCVIALGTVVMSFIAWKLYEEFAWNIYKQISADLRLKRRFLIYQIYIAVLKFDFFLFLGFEVQFLVIVSNTTNVELWLTIASVPVTIALLLFAAWSTKRENKAGMISTIVVYFGAMAYFFFKLVRMYRAEPKRIEDYRPARRTLTTFAVITIILLLVTIVIACWCTLNFGKGLKPHVSGFHIGGRRKNAAGGRKPVLHDAGQDFEQGSGYYPDKVQLDSIHHVPGAGYSGGGRMTID